jgi:hypothetical protein
MKLRQTSNMYDGHPDYVKEGVKCSCCSHVFCLKGSTFVLGSS